jgi:hypothetical protein
MYPELERLRLIVSRKKLLPVCEYQIDQEEFLEFCEAGEGPTKASPAFRERLRGELWALIRSGG